MTVLAAISIMSSSGALASAAAEPAAAEAADDEPVTASKGYVHKWLPMPGLSGERLGREGQLAVAPRPGRMLVVLFLASWCEPCQQMIQDFRALEKRFARLPVDFAYVFAHDTRADAEGFMQEFKMSEAVLATPEILKSFKNPELPTVYVGDRHGFMTGRYPNAGKSELAALDRFLKLLTAY